MADREWTADDVADHFEEAFRALRRAGFTSVMQLQAGRWVEREIR